MASISGPLNEEKKKGYNSGMNSGMRAKGKFSTKGRTIGMNIGKNIGDTKGEKWKKRIGKFGYHSQSGSQSGAGTVQAMALAGMLACVLGVLAIPFVLWNSLVPVASAQEGSTVNLYQGPPKDPTQTLLFYSGSNLQYVCVAPSRGSKYQLSVTAATVANPTVLTITGHNWSLTPPITPLVSISGGTGDWTVLNGTFIATPVDANTFTIKTATAGAAVNCGSCSALTGTIVLTATAPRLNQPIWSIKQFFYDGSNNLIGSAWVNGASGLSQACSSRASAGLGWQ